MKSSPKLFLSLVPGFIIGMFFQFQISSNQAKASSNTAKMSWVSKAVVDSEAQRFKDAGCISKVQRVYGASFSKNEVEQIVNESNGAVYVRVGFTGSVMTLYLGNEKGEYTEPMEDGYCPSTCPFNN